MLQQFQSVNKGKYSKTLLLRTPFGPEKVFVLQSVVIKWVNFKENVWSGNKKTVRYNECYYSGDLRRAKFHCKNCTLHNYF